MTDFKLRLILWPIYFILTLGLSFGFIRAGYLIFKIAYLSNLNLVPASSIITPEIRKGLIFSIKLFFICLGLIILLVMFYHFIAYCFNIPIARH